METAPYVGMVARFFHPRTLGVMHEGKVTKVHENGEVTVKFYVDQKAWRTCPEFIKPQSSWVNKDLRDKQEKEQS